MDEHVFVVVGASLAGARAAVALRDGGFDGRVVLIGEEAHLPYERPELSKHYLLGERQLGDLLVHPPSAYAAHGVELLTSTTVTGIDRAGRRVLLADGPPIRFDRLLLATGSVPRRLDIPGADLPGVVTLRTVSDADDLREAIPSAGRVVVVGAGWIGCEVAASARTLGAQVAIVAPEVLPLERVLGPEVGVVLRDLHVERGVELHLGREVTSIVGTDRASGVRTSGGEVIEGDLVVVGVGAVPRDDLARQAGLAVHNGVVVDEFLQSSDLRILAAGDIANAWHPELGLRLRVEHWANARNQGPAAAATMLGQRTPYTALPFFYSDQYDFGMEYRGHAPGWDRVVLRGDPATREFIAFWMLGRRVVAAMNANIWDQGEALEALIRSRATPDVRLLADPAVDIADLAARGS